MAQRYKFVFISVLAISSIITFSYLISFTVIDEDGTVLSPTSNMPSNVILYRHEFIGNKKLQSIELKKLKNQTSTAIKKKNVKYLKVSTPHGIKKSSNKKRVLINVEEDFVSSDTPLKEENIIAICVASTTRGIKNPSVDNMAMFTVLLPSLLSTMEKGYQYRLYIGYDVGDPWWDVSDRIAFEPTLNEMTSVAKKIGIELSYYLVHCPNPTKKPGPVFNCMLKVAYDQGAHFFARLNDDSEFRNPWTTTFRDFVLSRGPPYGVAGPWCNQGNQNILTHDFVHRTHMDIFNGIYYPPILSDWWMDDWITFVYGRNRTKRFQNVQMIHHIEIHKTRYEVDHSHKKALHVELTKGRAKIANWAKENNLTHVVEEFTLPFKKYNVYRGRLI